MQRRRGKNRTPGPPVGPGGDGHPGVTDSRFLEGIFNQGQYPNVMKEFVHPGKEPGEILMRCVFKDDREANAAVLWLQRCEEFGMERHKRLLLHKLAASTSIKGERIKILLQAVTGIVAPSLFGQEDKKGKGGEGL